MAKIQPSLLDTQLPARAGESHWQNPSPQHRKEALISRSISKGCWTTTQDMLIFASADQYFSDCTSYLRVHANQRRNTKRFCTAICNLPHVERLTDIGTRNNGFKGILSTTDFWRSQRYTDIWLSQIYTDTWCLKSSVYICVYCLTVVDGLKISLLMLMQMW